MVEISSAVIIALMVAGPAAAQGFKAENGVIVVPHSNGFAVTGDAGLGARGIWCAAADYARGHEGAKSAQRLYIVQDRAPGLGQRKPVVFTLDPAGLIPSSVLILGASLSRAGANLSIGHAYSYCADSKLARSGDR